MKQNINKFLKYKKILTLLIFSSLLVVGIIIYDDYGISWDENYHRGNGFVTLNYIRNLLSLNTYPGFPDLENYFAAQYGVIFDLPMAYFEKLFLISDSRNYFLMRHFINFLIYFASCICFYLLLKRRFTYVLSIIGLLFFILSPRIFADSFYNMKDLIFLSLFVISLYFSVKFLDRISYKNAIFASLFCSMAISSRIMGIIVPFIIIIFFIFETLDDKKYFKKNFLIIILFIFLCCIFTVIFWPYLWSDPLVNFFSTLKNMSAYIWRGSVFYLGNYISAENLPWHYSIIWILITTPLLYISLFILGSLVIFLKTIKKFLNFDEKKNVGNLWSNSKERLELISFAIFYLTLFLVISINSTLYGGWRHLYFIYPSLIFISIIGLEFISNKINYKYLLIIVFPFLIYSTQWMVKNHPYQFVYFNSLAGKNINNNFEIDYWGTSNLHILNYLLEYDKKKEIKIYIFSDSPYYFSLPIIDKNQRDRIKFINDINSADYLVTNHYYAFGKRKKIADNPTVLNNILKKKFILIKEIKVDNFPINSIYKVKE